jgi:flagellar hook assembly protein FlgD
MKQTNWGKYKFRILMIFILVTAVSGLVKANDKKSSLTELWSKEFLNLIQTVSLKLDKNGALESVSVQTSDENKCAKIHYLDGNGKTVNEKNIAQKERAFLLPDGKWVFDSEEWTHTKVKKRFANGKTKNIFVAKGERNIRIEDSNGNLVENKAVINSVSRQGDLFFSNDGSICFVRDYADEGIVGGYEIYGQNGILMAKEENPKDAADHVFFSPDSQYVGFCVGDKLILLNRNGQKVFEYKFEVFDKRFGPGIEQCGFSKDGTKIVILSRTNLIVLSKNGDVLAKTSLPQPSVGNPRFLFLNNEIVFNDASSIWTVDSQFKLKLVKKLGDIGVIFRTDQIEITSMGVIDQNIVAALWGKYAGCSIVVLNRNGDVLETKGLANPGYITTKGNYLAVQSKGSVSLFRVE